MTNDPTEAVEAVFREESGRIIATLIRLARSFDRAEEAMQEALASALASWPRTGIPQNPAAWITATAQRKVIDRGRRDKTRETQEEAVRYELGGPTMPDDPFAGELLEHLPDDRLRLIFTCCHPALNREAQVGLTLRTLGGLTTREIARAFLMSEASVAQRLVRAQRKISEAGIPYRVPSASDLPERLEAVEAVIYLIFNEGYSAASGDRLVRVDLCKEAIRLGTVLEALLPEEPESLALLGLMLLHDSRRDARVVNGQLVTLEEQDRRLWDRDAITDGLVILDRARRAGSVGPYLLQAEIAALHAQAGLPQAADWAQVAALYEQLVRMAPSPVIALNYAAALGMSGRLNEALARIDSLGTSGDLDRYYLFHAARADVLRRLNRRDESVDAYREALALATNPVEQAFLRRRLGELGIAETTAS